ncbi:oxygen-independent coproporphyrinogen III oxidase [Cereibacter azotoformans]|uniref:Coproporphyrinogen-III oxidase n=1 Tax=Cereibacter azotoformans TaxID=43057 RepID=A0A2T5JXM2_9RHOB|nr:oxygen-independent coproporphyrinogen III oxidase [Cereibacter azotoformans]AXQ92758.1 oxygen-independent coproporphyrinogen III oxidase [Cereibacter sphaeroides]MBO4169629.1 oxygen-independent coproporphyrinogen III oxidase [Cereibacter azotoformans]PTR14906.1 oxygen-independent coproporphyrinogen-3 oxidase [Cereibacter azotoformans]UIJ31041.1 oxygen-independent coproporphyrinogen III oxidase [Cereibacter azotoformans]
MESVSHLAKLGLFDARVPRYTSYPTAPHFGEGVTQQLHAGWISSIPAGSSVSLYLHVPFCRRLCWFCACRTQGTSSDAPVRAYAAALKSEIALIHARLAPGVRLSRMHWGGGTPTLLPPDLIRELVLAIRDALPYGPETEFSVEVDPNEIDAARLDALFEAGMNRVSIGVQDFDPMIQKAIGREQGHDLTRRLTEDLRACGLEGLDIDMLYGLPHQTPQGIAATVQKLLALSPDRVAVLGYAHVPAISRRQLMIPTAAIPRPEERLGLFETARDLILWDGYQPVGLDRFARAGDPLAHARACGRLRRSFAGYTDDRAETLIGIGASAISRFPQGFTQNAPSTSDHLRAIRSGRFSTSRGHALTDEDRLRGRMIEQLLCDFRISRAQILARFAITPERLEALFRSCAAAFPGMVEITGHGLEITDEGRPLTRMIARTFDAYDQSRRRPDTV